MLQRNEHHTFTGMQKDLAISKHPSKYLVDARNIRLTQREDGSTLLAITNEKGVEDTDIYYAGQYYLGHCLIGKYLVVFSTNTKTQDDVDDDGDFDYIERVDLSDVTKVELFNANLRFSSDHLVECLGSYESERIQKVYWTDGINPPRVINIADKDDEGHQYDYHAATSNIFDFVPTLKLGETVSIVKNTDTGGMFPAGVIQYAFTYYNKYRQESNIFYSSELHSISHKYRGGDPEDKVSNSFSITIDNIDDSFEYLRVYSILRTSEEGTPVVKRVIDVPIKTDTTSISVVDTGTIGDVVDPTLLLYIGGEEIIAQTMTAKDGTLFLGDLEIKRKDIVDDLKASIQNHSKNIDFENEETVDIPTADSSSFYTYYNSIDIPPFYKIGEHYRFGIQFQHESGRWSAPIVLQSDYRVEGNRPAINNGTLTFAVGKTSIEQTDVSALQKLGYKRARGVVVLPTLHDRLILTQGALCPTVFNTEMRTANAPFAMSSWFGRPDSPSRQTSTNTDGRSSEVKDYGNYMAYEQYASVASKDWWGEVDGYKSTNIRDSLFLGVDRSILTMHSPDVEFDSNMTDSTYSGWKLKLIGRALLSSTVSDVDIQTESPAKESYDGFKKISFITSNAGINAGRSLIAAPMWEDSIFKSSLDGETVIGSKRYMVYPWQKQGSLNNDSKRPDGSIQTALLKKKKMSILHYCENTVWHNDDITFNTLSNVGLFSSDQMELNFLGDIGGSTYYGNVDTLLNRGECPIYAADKVTSEVTALPTKINGTDITYKTAANVRMKYKSGRHLFFNLGNKGDVIQTLPYISTSTSTTSAPVEVPWKIEGKEPDTSVEEQAVLIYAKGQYQEGSAYGRIYDLYNSTKPEIGDLVLMSNGLLGTNEEFTVYEMDTAWVEETQQRPTPSQGGQILVQTIVKEYTVVNTMTNEEIERDVTYYALASPMQQLADYYACNIGQHAIEYYQTDHQTGKLLFLYARSSSSKGTTNINYAVIKYKPADFDIYNSYFWIGELYRDNVTNAFGGDSKDAYKSNLWIPAGEPVALDTAGTEITFRYGDTYYQRYDCLKTYAFTNEDENSVIDIMSFMCESRVNADGRYDKNRGKISNLMMSPVNFNLHNPVYSQKNNYFTYRILDEDFYTNNHFPNQFTWTKEKQASADTDLWTNVTLANTYDMDGGKGEIVSLNTWKDQIFCFQNRGISNILFNSRVQIPTSDGMPIEISNNYKVDGYRYLSDGIGCSNKWTIKETPAAVYFIDSTGHHLYSIGDGIQDITLNKNMSSWFKENGLLVNKTLYDDVHHDIYLVKDDESLCYSELLGEFTSLMDYRAMNALESYNGEVFSLHNRVLYNMFTGNYNYFFDGYKPWYLTFVSNGLDAGEMDFDKVFSNIDYRLDFFYNDDYYPDDSFDFMRVWNEYQDTQEVTLSSRNDGKGYKTSKFYREGNPQKKYKIWRLQIPRAKKLKDGQYVSTNDRIRNPWCTITLGRKTKDSLRAVLQDLNVQYYI